MLESQFLKLHIFLHVPSFIHSFSLPLPGPIFSLHSLLPSLSLSTFFSCFFTLSLSFPLSSGFPFQVIGSIGVKVQFRIVYTVGFSLMLSVSHFCPWSAWLLSEPRHPSVRFPNPDGMNNQGALVPQFF